MKKIKLDKLSNDIVHLKSQTAFESDVVFIADEKIPYIPKIMLNGCKEQLKLKAYEDFSCDIDNLYLIGSAAGKIISPQEAKYQAQYLMNQLFKDNNIGLKTFPKVFEGQNEIASFGINEQDISDIENYTIKKVHINSSINYLAQNSSYGLIKLIIKDNLIKGAHIIANNANELITPLVMAIENEITTDKLKEQVFIYSPEFSLILDMLE